MGGKTAVLTLSMILLAVCSLRADDINGITMDFVTIGNPGNPADTDADPERNGYGSVGYTYRIGVSEVSVEQFVASGIDPGNVNGPDPWGPGSMPAVFISWHEAARYCNWLTSGSTTSGAYTVSGNFVTAIDRAAALGTYGTVYVLPTENEWYKAAYYTGSGYSLYANGLSTAPVKGVGAMYSTNTVWGVGAGLAEQNGTRNMMGNVWEWSESALDGTHDNVGSESIAFRGGAWNLGSSIMSAGNRGSDSPGNTFNSVGLRVVAIPEPGTISLMGLSTLGLFVTRSMRRRRMLGRSLMPICRDHLCDSYCTLEEWEKAQDELLSGPDMLSITWELVQPRIHAVWVKAQGGYRELDRRFWNFMAISYERRLAKRKAFRAAVKKKALNSLDAFLAKIMK